MYRLILQGQEGDARGAEAVSWLLQQLLHEIVTDPVDRLASTMTKM